jgi:membrane protease YdiL (CAAX protease family)
MPPPFAAPPVTSPATRRLSPGTLATIYSLATCLLSWSYLALARGPLAAHPWIFVIIVMWIPATLSISMRLAFREGFTDIGPRVGAPRYWAIAYAGPFALATLTYALAWLIGQVHISPYLPQQSMFGPLPIRLTWWNASASTTGLLAQRLALVATLSISLGFLPALGEEIGWRGYLLPKLIQARVRFPILTGGLIWGIWHVPFVLLTFEHKPYATAAIYVLICVAFAPFIGWLRLASGSVLVAAMAHASYNAFYQDFFDHSFAGPHKWLWAGEVGLFCSLCSGLVALFLYRTNHITPFYHPPTATPSPPSPNTPPRQAPVAV